MIFMVCPVLYGHCEEQGNEAIQWKVRLDCRTFFNKNVRNDR